MSEFQETTPGRRRTSFRQLLSFAVVSGLICWLIEYPIQPVLAEVNPNHLLIGDEAVFEGSYAVPILAPREFDGLTVEEIMRLRMQEVWRHPLLIGKNYEPSRALFSRLRNRVPWKSSVKQADGDGDSSSNRGIAAESFFVLNPYLLIAADVIAVDDFDGQSHEAVTGTRQDGPDTSLFDGRCRPLTLTWHPNLARAEVHYDVTRYLEEVSETRQIPISTDALSIRLWALNASDMNLNYAAILPQASSNVVHPLGRPQLIAIEQFFRHGYDCGRDKGCNEISPPQSELAEFRITSLPAAMEVRLWRDPPREITDPPALRFLLTFE